MSICISLSDAVKHGCPFCNFRSSTSRLTGQGASVQNCDECLKEFIVLKDGLDISPFGETDNEGQIIYPTLKEHPKKDVLAKGNIDSFPDRDEYDTGEYFSPRGIGVDITNGCVYCNTEHSDYSHNVSGFIRTKEAGYRLLDWFDKGKSKNTLERIGVLLDYREHEPDRIQFKIGACDKHIKNLKLLDFYIRLNGTITKKYLEKSKKFKLPNLKESLTTYIENLKQISEDYYSFNKSNDFQRGKLDSLREVESFLENFNSFYN